MNHSRDCANDNGTTAGRSAAATRESRSAPSSRRGANWATVGASNNARTETPASRAAFTAAIRRIADSESPPRSKKESSTPTRSTPSTWA
ncbi:hypothetical protein MINTM002_31350 [Mycobacterium intracellulare]|nr:hypothetical protein MINTM002_31350 [Mycobacterium intracellulare]BCO52656.1 hypothetical protein MINTM003_30970 [Mycobacterium paraintracellulare]BCO68548.1 hypothetical protein MINTM007_31590 [Mycobacterium intracellulare]